MESALLCRSFFVAPLHRLGVLIIRALLFWVCIKPMIFGSCHVGKEGYSYQPCPFWPLPQATDRPHSPSLSFEPLQTEPPELFDLFYLKASFKRQPCNLPNRRSFQDTFYLPKLHTPNSDPGVYRISLRIFLLGSSTHECVHGSFKQSQTLPSPL